MTILGVILCFGIAHIWIWGCAFKDQLIWRGWDKKHCFLKCPWVPPWHLFCPTLCARWANHKQHERLWLCNRLPRRVGTFPAAGVLPPKSEHHAERFHRDVRPVSRRHAASSLPHSRARQPHPGVEEQQRPPGGEPQRRFGAQPVLKIQTWRYTEFLGEGFAARRWC